MLRRKTKRRGKILIRLLLIAALCAIGFFLFRPAENTLLLVNKLKPLSAGYVPSNLVSCRVRFADNTPQERTLLKRSAARALANLFEAAEEDGVTLYAVSGYRSYDSQRGIYERRLAQTSLEYVSRYIAKAGESEHQTGLAMDVNCENSRDLTEDFADTDAYRWLCGRASDFGFIVRYPKNGEAETGYAFEPWHLRYVGDEAAQIAQSGLTLEAYLSLNHPSLA